MYYKATNNIKIVISKLDLILTKNNVCPSHGIDHAIKVMKHAIKALKSGKYKITSEESECVVLAGLLHDADDGKFFPLNLNYENAKFCLQDYKSPESIELIILMIKLVSSTKNKDNIPDFVIGKEWMLIPRYADRVEALGLIGIERCYQYNKTIKSPLYLESTPRAKNLEELWNIASETRYNNYMGKSVSMIDQYYDKLLRLGFFPIKNKYLVKLANKGMRQIIDFVLWFGSKGTINDLDIINYTNSYFLKNK